MSGTRTIGYALFAVGALWLLGAAAVFLSGVVVGEVDLPAALIGIMVFGGPVAAALWIGGVALVAKGRRDDARMADAKFERRVMDMIETHGAVRLRDMAEDLGCELAEVEDALHDLVGKRLFQGFINWHDGRAYSQAAANIESSACPNCGGKLDLAGKDLAACPYCDTEIFLERD